MPKQVFQRDTQVQIDTVIFLAVLIVAALKGNTVASQPERVVIAHGLLRGGTRFGPVVLPAARDI